MSGSNVPLTTVFTPHPSCSTDYVMFTRATNSTARHAWAYTFLAPSDTAAPASTVSVLTTISLCEPPKISSVLRRTRQSAFSPGICPFGFTTATSSFISNTMHAYCCLDGYNLEEDVLLDERYFQMTASLPLLQCRKALSTSVPIMVVSSARGFDRVLQVVATSTVEPPFFVEHDAMSVAWRPQELGVFPTDAVPTLNTDVEEERLALETLESSGTSQVTGETPIRSDVPEDNSEGLSNGAKIGIGVGAGIVALALIGATVWFILKRRRNKNGQAHAAGYGIEKDGTNNLGGIDDTPTVTGGITDSR